MPSGNESKPPFGEINAMFIEDGGGDSEEGFIGAVVEAGPNSWKDALFGGLHQDWTACVIGGIVGMIFASLCIPATLKAGILPGLSQITLVVSCSAVFKMCSGITQWAGWSDKLGAHGKQRYLLILQSAGSATSAMTFALCCATPAYLMMERKKANALLEPGTPDKKDRELLDVMYYVGLVMACVGGSFTGAGWTNINMAKSLKDDHPAPEARASASLIGTYSVCDPSDDKSRHDEVSGPGENVLKGKDAWFTESFWLPLVFAIVSGTIIWAGFVSGYIEIQFWHKEDTMQSKIEDAWAQTVDPTTQQKYWALGPDGAKIGPAMLVGTGIFVSAIRGMRSSMGFLIESQSAPMLAGIGSMLSLRSTICMMMGAVTYVLINWYGSDVYARRVNPDTYKDHPYYRHGEFDKLQEHVMRQGDMLSGRTGNMYKWIGVTVVIINTVWILLKMGIKTVRDAKDAARIGRSQKVKPGLERPAWVNKFNIVCVGAGYAITLGFLFMFSDNVPMASRVILMVVTLIADYALNMIGGLQSLTVGGAVAPVSSCLMLSGIGIGCVRLTEASFRENDLDKQAELGDTRLFGFWVLRMFVSIIYTNDAAQDYATTQMLKHNIYVATRQNLLTALVGSIVVPAVFYFFVASSESGFGPGNDYKAAPAEVYMTLTEGIETGIVPLHSVGFGVLLAIIATVIEEFVRTPADRHEGIVARYVRFVFTGFSCTGFALGIYLGTETPSGTFLGAAVVVIAQRKLGRGAGEINKELYLTAVAFIGGHAMATVIQVLYILVDMSFGLGGAGWGTPFFGWKTVDPTKLWKVEDDGSSIPQWKAAWDDGNQSEVQTPSGLVSVLLVLAVLFMVWNSGVYGHEMEMAILDGGESSDSEAADASDSEAEYVQGGLESALGYNLGKNDSIAIKYHETVREAKTAELKAHQMRLKKQAALDDLTGQITAKGWAKRNSKDVEADQPILRRNAIIGIFMLFVISAVGYAVKIGDDRVWVMEEAGPNSDSLLYRSGNVFQSESSALVARFNVSSTTQSASQKKPLADVRDG